MRQIEREIRSDRIALEQARDEVDCRVHRVVRAEHGQPEPRDPGRVERRREEQQRGESVRYVVEKTDGVLTEEHVLTGICARMVLMHWGVETGDVTQHDNQAEENGKSESTQPNRTI